jgi:hypothetical protein
MKSKSYILMQIHDLLVNRHSYTPKRANMYIEEHKDDKVYELLVLKKKLNEDEPQCPDVSYRRSMWRSFEDDEED